MSEHTALFQMPKCAGSAVGSSGRRVTQAGEAQVGIRERHRPELISANGRGAVLTMDILFGMNLSTLVGFLVMGLSLTLHGTGNVGVPWSIGLMCAGTALVFYGLFSADLSN